jgi:hypothetical protein
VLGRGHPVEAAAGGQQVIVGEGLAAVPHHAARVDLDAAIELGARGLRGGRRDVDTLPVPIGTCESMITMLISGRANRSCEWLVSGEETQRKLA